MRGIFRVRLLGSVVIERNGTPVRGFESRKALSLFCYLAIQGHPVSRSHLADLFWGDKPEARGRGNLSRVLNNLSTLVPGCIETERDTVVFRYSQDIWLDTKEFEDLVSQGHLPTVTEAVGLHRGEFMADMFLDDCPEFETWLVAERERWHRRVVQALLILIDHRTHRGEYAKAIEYTSRLLTLDPWREEGHQQMMMLLSMSGQHSAALAQYQTCRQILQEALSVEPSEETTALYNRLRTDRSNSEVRGLQRSPLALRTTHSSRRSQAANHLPFVGRAEQHAWVTDQWDNARYGHGQFTLLEGEPGIGKTRLAEEVLRFIESSGALVLRGNCYEFEVPVPYQPIAAALREQITRISTSKISSHPWTDFTKIWLAELAQLLPEIREFQPDLALPSYISSETNRERLFEATARFLLALVAEHKSLVFFLDDLHWADQATVDMLRYLVYRLQDAHIWFLGSYRRADTAADHPLRQLCRTLVQQDLVAELTLPPLDAAALEALVESLSFQEDAESKRLLMTISQRAEGNPFILNHILQDLEKQAILKNSGGQRRINPDWLLQASAENLVNSIVPGNVQEMVLERVNRLSPRARSLLQLAAIIGRHFELDLLQTAAQMQEPIGDVIDECVGRHLISFSPSSQYGFTHDMIRQVIYETLPPWQRMQLHGQVAAALEELHEQKEDAIVAELAHHYTQSRNREPAIKYLLLAAERAKNTYAWDAAASFYHKALAQLDTDDIQAWYEILASRERVNNRASRREAQDADLKVLENLARRLDDPIREADVLCRRAEWALRVGRFAFGVEVASKAIELAQNSGCVDIVASARRWGALCLNYEGQQYQQAQSWAQQALALCDEQRDQRGHALALGILGHIALARGYLEEALLYMETAVEAWRQLEDLWHLATSLTFLSDIHQRFGDYQGALIYQLDARQLAAKMGDPYLDASSLIGLGTTYHGLKQYEEALTIFKEALDLAYLAAAPDLQMQTLLAQGHTLLAMGRVEQAEQSYNKSLALQQQFGILAWQPETLSGLADCQLASGHVEEVLALLAEAEAGLQAMNRAGLSEILLRRATAHTSTGNFEKARATVAHLLSTLEQPDSQDELPPEAWLRIRHILQTSKDKEQDQQMLQRVDQLLHGYAGRLTDPDLRRFFLRAATEQDTQNSRAAVKLDLVSQ